MRDEQALLALLEIQDLGDLFVEIRDLVLQVLIALVLIVDRATHLPVDGERDNAGEHQRRDRTDAEFLASLFALGFAPGK